MNLPNKSEQTIDGANDRLLRKRELAQRLGISIRTCDAWQRQGRICHLKIGRSCRYRWNDVIAKLQSYRVN